MSEDYYVEHMVPAAAGWRTISVYLGSQGDVEWLTDEQLFLIRPIAAFVAVRRDGFHTIFPVMPDDWPQYLDYGSDAEDEILAYLAPGEGIKEFHREEARRLILDHRSRLREVQ